MNPNLPKIALVGRPNVGKSTLFNRFIGRRLALVDDTPGITRDRRYGTMNWAGMDYTVIDTGGMEESSHELKAAVTKGAIAALHEADLIIFVVDGRSGIVPQDLNWLKKIRQIQKPYLVAVNKIDTAKTDVLAVEFYETGEKLNLISAEGGRGISELLDEVDVIIKKTFQSNITSSPEEDKPVGIALIGRPNVGKSSLLNKLLNDERAIVSSIPGTTMDPVDTLIEYQGTSFLLIDTAGIRRRGRASEKMEKVSVQKGIESIEKSHVILLLLDGEEGISEQDAHVVGEALKRYKAVLLVVNKWDLGSKNKTQDEVRDEMSRKLNFISYAPILFISAKTGKNIDKVWSTIQRVVGLYKTQIKTSELNKNFEKIIKSHPLPMFAGKAIKIYYATQVGTMPPRFAIFANQPSHIHFSYRRYLQNAIRKSFGMMEVPICLTYRSRSS